MTDNYVLVFSIDFDNFYIESLPDIAIIVKHLNDVYLGTGKECLHNKVYWSLGQYIGFGPGAESSIGYSEAVSMREPETIEEYIRKPELTCFNLTREETEEEVLLTSLRTIYGIDKGEYSKRFGKDFDALYSERISALDPDCYIDSPDRFSLTEEGFLKLDRIILEMAMAL